MNPLPFTVPEVPPSEVPPSQDRHAGFIYKFLIASNIGYECCDGNARPNGCGGVLAKGTALWLTAPLTDGERLGKVTGFIERLGLVRVPARYLIALGRDSA